MVRVHELVPQAEWETRYDTINAFERELVDGGTSVLKVFLHVGFNTQRERLLARLDDPDKHWKYKAGDVDERALWNDYQAAYKAVLEAHVDRPCPVVSRARRPQEVPELGRRAAAAREARRTRPAVPASGA
ncbi:MAG: hypothetical protein ABJA87_08120 [bacterium]